MDHAPRKRGRPPKHPKPIVGPLSPSALAPHSTRSVGNNSPVSDSNPHSSKSFGIEGQDDVEMLERPPMVRTGHRGRPQKRGVPMKKIPSPGGGSGGLTDREYPLSKDMEGGALEADDKTLRRKKPTIPKLNLADAAWHTGYDAENGLEDVKDAPFMDAVVKVFCVHTEPNFSLPWQRKRQFSSNSSGFIIGDRRVLTNAHSVEHHTQVKVKKRGSDTKDLATVLAIGTECDIGTEVFLSKPAVLCIESTFICS
jgi:hypothetical protein